MNKGMGFFDFSSLVKSTEQAALQISSIDAAEQLAKEQAAKEVADAAQATADKAAQEKYEKDNTRFVIVRNSFSDYPIA